MDLILRGGTVIDGTSAPARVADVAIHGDRIAAVDRLGDVAAARVIDVAGRVVAPGFIDVHNHSDGWLLKTPNFVSKTAQGFTTEVLGSDGISYAPIGADNARDWMHYLRPLDGLQISDYCGWTSIGEYLSLLDRRTAQNVAMQVPYANVRVLAKGWDRHPPDDGQLRQMLRHVELGLEQGAVGLSTGLDYIAQCFATTSEIAEVCAPLRQSRAIYATHVRYKKGLLAGVAEAVAIGRAAGVGVHISHLKAETPEAADEVLTYVDTVAAHEVDLSFDVYPYLPGSSMLTFLLPYELWERGPLAALERLTRPELRRRLALDLELPVRPRLDKVRIAWVGSRENAHWQGATLADYVAASGQAAADAICDLLIMENLSVLMIAGGTDDAVVEPFLAHERAMLASDGIFFPDAPVHPRQYGSAPRLLGPLVRDRKLLTLEQAVYKLTGFPAQRFGLKDRGALRAGAFADVVVFDPQRVADRATYREPHQTPAGIEHVLVNGTPVICDGALVEEFSSSPPGRALSCQR